MDEHDIRFLIQDARLRLERAKSALHGALHDGDTETISSHYRSFVLTAEEARWWETLATEAGEEQHLLPHLLQENRALARQNLEEDNAEEELPANPDEIDRYWVRAYRTGILSFLAATGNENPA